MDTLPTVEFLINEIVTHSYVVRASSGDEAIKARARGEGTALHDPTVSRSARKMPVPDQPIHEPEWPLWAKALKRFAKPQDKGLGDVIARTIGDERSEAFKKWHKATFGKPCGCSGRQALLNQTYPLTFDGKS